MTATTVDRDTPALHIARALTFDIKASAADIPAGGIVCTDATGFALNGSDTAGLIVQGRAAHAASYANGDRKITVERGTFYWANDGTVTKAAIGTNATILDNQTASIATTTTSDIVLGKIEDVDAVLGVAVSTL